MLFNEKSSKKQCINVSCELSQRLQLLSTLYYMLGNNLIALCVDASLSVLNYGKFDFLATKYKTVPLYHRLWVAS